jgi:hypothetical protein
MSEPRFFHRRQLNPASLPLQKSNQPRIEITWAGGVAVKITFRCGSVGSVFKFLGNQREPDGLPERDAPAAPQAKFPIVFTTPPGRRTA